MITKLERIAKIAKERPKEKFTSLMHLINEESLIECHNELKGNRAVGVDGVSKDNYGKNINANIRRLVEQMKAFKYIPKPVRRVHIPKAGSNKKRPLGIPSHEDKIVQMGINKILTCIYEQEFIHNSFGFRKNKGCHDALRTLNNYLNNGKINYVVDADIKGFFDSVNHKWLMKFLEHRIIDKNFLRYISRFLKSGVMENGIFHKSYDGTPQGGLISPTLGNIYLHYVLDLWFEKVVKKYCKGEAYIVRYCDDFVCCFEYKNDVDRFYNALIKRLRKFSLEIAEEKTKIIEFGKRAYYRNKNNKVSEKIGTFDFLGFTHYCSCSLKGRFRVKRKTSSKKFRSSMMKVNEWIKANMHLPVDILIHKLNRKLIGYFRYYGVTDNYRSISKFKDDIQRKLFRALNRRSQRRSYNWEEYRELLKIYKLAKCKIYVNLLEVT